MKFLGFNDLVCLFIIVCSALVCLSIITSLEKKVNSQGRVEAGLGLGLGMVLAKIKVGKGSR